MQGHGRWNLDGCEPRLHGFLLIDKPAGWTSHDVVAKLRGILRQRRVGHGGTLDPFATGLLIVGVGRATRLLQYAQRGDKRYLAHIVLGAGTTTDDVDGEVLESREFQGWPRRADVEDALARFVGTIKQRPPRYSAVRVDGERMYARSRRGETVETPLRTVTITEIELIEYRPPDLILSVTCSSGTYIRSIARDLGECLGTAAYCHGLRRLWASDLSVGDAVTVDELMRHEMREVWRSFSLHPDAVVTDLPALAFSEDQTVAWYHGRPAVLGYLATDGEARIYGFDGRFAGIANIHAGIARPSIVFRLD